MESAQASAQLRFVGRRQVSAVALGGASWSFEDYARWLEATPHPVDDDLAIRTIHAALDGGIRLIARKTSQLTLSGKTDRTEPRRKRLLKPFLVSLRCLKKQQHESSTRRSDWIRGLLKIRPAPTACY